MKGSYVRSALLLSSILLTTACGAKNPQDGGVVSGLFCTTDARTVSLSATNGGSELRYWVEENRAYARVASPTQLVDRRCRPLDFEETLTSAYCANESISANIVMNDGSRAPFNVRAAQWDQVAGYFAAQWVAKGIIPDGCSTTTAASMAQRGLAQRRLALEAARERQAAEAEQRRQAQAEAERLAELERQRQAAIVERNERCASFDALHFSDDGHGLYGEKSAEEGFSLDRAADCPNLDIYTYVEHLVYAGSVDDALFAVLPRRFSSYYRLLEQHPGLEWLGHLVATDVCGSAHFSVLEYHRYECSVELLAWQKANASTLMSEHFVTKGGAKSLRFFREDEVFEVEFIDGGRAFFNTNDLHPLRAPTPLEYVRPRTGNSKSRNTLCRVIQAEMEPKFAVGDEGYFNDREYVITSSTTFTCANLVDRGDRISVTGMAQHAGTDLYSGHREQHRVPFECGFRAVSFPSGIWYEIQRCELLD